MNGMLLNFVIFLCITLLSGCAPNVSELKNALDVQLTDYTGVYSKQREVHYWAGHSGSTDETEITKIQIAIAKAEFIDYVQEYNASKVSGPIFRLESYVKDKSSLCSEFTLNEAPCNPAAFNTLTYDKKGCELADAPEATCICNGQKISMETTSESPTFPCLEEIPAISPELNIEDGRTHAAYEPESKKGFCYRDRRNKGTGQLWASPCIRSMSSRVPPTIVRPQVLAILGPPQVQNPIEPFKNVKCVGDGTHCTCTFDPIKALNCSGEQPHDVDKETKEAILRHLSEIDMKRLSKTKMQDGTCYSVFDHNLEQKFCFEPQGLVKFAQWGHNISEPMSTRINIQRIEKLS